MLPKNSRIRESARNPLLDEKIAPETSARVGRPLTPNCGPGFGPNPHSKPPSAKSRNVGPRSCTPAPTDCRRNLERRNPEIRKSAGRTEISHFASGSFTKPLPQLARLNPRISDPVYGRGCPETTTTSKNAEPRRCAPFLGESRIRPSARNQPLFGQIAPETSATAGRTGPTNSGPHFWLKPHENGRREARKTRSR